MDAWQITLAADGRGRLADLGAAVRATGRVLGPRGLLFSFADDHGHFAVAGDRAGAARAAAGLSRALGRSTALEPARITAVDGRSHLLELVAYFARQAVKHGLGVHPAAWPGNCVGDLVGVRRVAGFDPGRVRHRLPRLTPEAILRTVELGTGAIREATEEELWGHGPTVVAASAAAALGVDLHDPSGAGVDARAAVATLFARARSADVAFALGVSDRTARWLRAREVSAETLALVRRRVTWDAVVRAAPPVTPSPREREALARSPFR